MPRSMMWLALVVAMLFGAVWFLAGAAQRAMLFPAPEGGVAEPPPGAEQVWLEVDGHRVEAWWFPLERRSRPMPTVLFAHGNGERIGTWADLPRGLARLGFATLLVEYPGYGRSHGRPSERSISAAMLAGHDWLTSRDEVDAERIVAYGRSLGGGAVARLIGRRELAGLVLESTFTSVPAMARSLGIPDWVARLLVRDRFDTLGKLVAFRGPVLVVHGEHDEVAPVWHGRALAMVAGTEPVELPCGHNDCPRPWADLERFLRPIGG